MSGSSFPRAEHVALLRRKIEERIRQGGRRMEVAERGLNQLKCQYKFGLKRESSDEWVEIAIHFQVAERLETTGSDAELNRIVEGFLDRQTKGGNN